MASPEDTRPDSAGAAASHQIHDGPERRRPEQQDRRTRPRGGRRAGDMFRDVATFVYHLLTEPPR